MTSEALEQDVQRMMRHMDRQEPAPETNNPAYRTGFVRLDLRGEGPEDYEDTASRDPSHQSEKPET